MSEVDENYLALYRQYRPKRFSEVKGQEHIVRALKNVIISNKINHAYLFCGPHGTGKTSVAKIFANTINCSHSEDLLNPCQNCIDNIDRNLDIIEIDAASNTGIDDIRDLRDKIKHLPTNSKYKIYIIDEVHMLSKGAFNAFLKTLEEPPKHAILILATTDPQKIPLTILSRVQRFNFKRIDKQIILEHLQFVYGNEKINSDLAALDLISQLANGSLRDALSIADQVSIYSNDKKIILTDVQKLFGITDKENVIKLLNLSANHNIKDLIELYNKLVLEGINLERLITSMINLLKEYIVYNKTQSISLLENYTLLDLKMLDLSLDKCYEFINLLVEIFKDVKFADFPQQVCELGLMKLASLKTHDENFKNEIKEETFNIEKVTNNNDFVVLEEKQDKKEVSKVEKIESSSLDKLNNFLDLSSIANKQKTQVTKLDVDKILEETNELLINEKTQEIERQTQETTILSPNDDSDFEVNTKNPSFANSNFQDYDDFEITQQVSTKETKTTGRSKELSETEFVDIIARCALYQKRCVEQNKIDITTSDKLKFSTFEKVLNEDYKQAKEAFQTMKILRSTNECILMKSSVKSRVWYLNENAYSEDIVLGSEKLFGRFVHIFAITEEQFLKLNELWKKHKKTYETGKVFEPLKDLSKMYKRKDTAFEKTMKSLFGDDFKYIDEDKENKE
ncbi:DNA polymerase-3 subunit gamma/tau [Metamycoplasma subdolum]|uniref:DNA polymerase III subunit gamma/tau n=1 Tax=Metamycoplasma subdolum TaxID=92407 RepID=A0A3M0A2F1_9BACT|nr:DNA polymerase III subunit gamma/tau [Metamycoplasma subdolum]RMA78624.1 DNA polymerase-3 subunit gamma/tau [Metamycoplasma subdolum]WPB50774.1 DNA polymerase III subunit gamma/tau [Metamycoplasma subdolum]